MTHFRRVASRRRASSRHTSAPPANDASEEERTGRRYPDSARVRPFPVREGTVILRGAIVFLGLMLLLCAAARAEKRVAQEVLVFPAAPTVGQSFVTFEPVGSWASRDLGRSRSKRRRNGHIHGHVRNRAWPHRARPNLRSLLQGILGGIKPAFGNIGDHTVPRRPHDYRHLDARRQQYHRQQDGWDHSVDAKVVPCLSTPVGSRPGDLAVCEIRAGSSTSRPLRHSASQCRRPISYASALRW